MKKITLAVVIAGLGSLLSGCNAGKACEHMGFEKFRAADRIEITDNLSNILRSINERQEIAVLTAFVIDRGRGWATPWAGTPIALVRANFYQRDRFIGDFGYGSTFLTAQGCGYFQSRDMTTQERVAIVNLFGVKDPYLNTK